MFKIIYVEHVGFKYDLSENQPLVYTSGWFSDKYWIFWFLKYSLYTFIIVYKTFISQENPKIIEVLYYLYGVLSLVPIAQERNLEPTYFVLLP